jgi:hypothetical protein
MAASNWHSEPHHDERGFASMHIYHVVSGTPVATILRPARTPIICGYIWTTGPLHNVVDWKRGY